MAQRIHRRTNDGNISGIKQDKFRNSDFEIDDRQFNRFGGVSRATPNTINGPWAENRGRRGDQVRLDNPFENGKLYNWNRRDGWEEYYEPRDREGRAHGGSLSHNDYGDLSGGHKGKGPRGYVRPDNRIFDDVCELLTRDRDIDAREIDVKVEQGIVTLTGKVQDRNTKRFAGEIAGQVSGVRDIFNLLEFDRR